MFQKSMTPAGPEPTLGDVGIAARVNGTAPPDVPLSDIDLGAWEFWVTGRRPARRGIRDAAPRGADLVSPAAGDAGRTGGTGPLGGDQVRRRLVRKPSSADLQFEPEHHDQRREPGCVRVLRVDDRDGRPEAPAAAQHRQQGVHPEGRRPHRGLGAGSGAPSGRDDDRDASRRLGRGGGGTGGPTAAAGDLRHDGHPRGRPSADVPLDQRDSRVRRQGHRDRLRGVRQGLDGHRRIRDRARRGPPRQPARRPDDRAGAGRGRRRAADVGRGRVVLHPAGGGGQRDHPQCDQPRRARAHALSR